MTEFDPEKFEEKYVHYLPELERAYRDAFEHMNDRYDSELVHAIDQQVLDDSEPVYEGDGHFRVVLPEDPVDRLDAVLVPDGKAEETITIYADRIETELRRIFGFEDGDDRDSE
ncbi:hypothetical protein BRD00_14720 [Halobacteriales archaeon QS_8_69_26]|nr:MAG: hypothetical protein BRD00_14720 [Halobacteriales archaeon QS_8_69_26]